MRRLLHLLLIALLGFGPATGAWATAIMVATTYSQSPFSVPTLIATGSAISSGSGVSTTVSAPAGSLIVIMANSGGTIGSNMSGCTLSSGDTVSTGAASGNVTIFYVFNSGHNLPVSGTVTCTTSGPTYKLDAYKVSGATGGLDTHTTFTSGGSNVGALSNATGALASTSEIAFAMTFVLGTNGTWTDSSGFSVLAGGSGGTLTDSWGLISTNTTYAPSWTNPGRTNNALVTFR